MRIFVTGATGFVGKALVNELVAEGHHVVAALRKQSTELPNEVEQKLIGDLSLLNEYNTIINTLDNIDAVIHAAARVHIMEDNAVDPLTEFRKINVNATLELARQAAEAGVKRFVFLSSIKVNGESTDNRQPFRESDDPAPEDAYGQSKLEAELALFELSKTTHMDMVIVRPPLIYGPGVKGNFASIMKFIQKGFPFPFGAIKNRRSFLALENLTNFIKVVLVHPNAGNEVFLLADDLAISTPDLINYMSKQACVQVKLIHVPVLLLKTLGLIFNKQKSLNKLIGCLQIDTSKAKKILGWRSVISFQDQLEKMRDK